MKRMLLGLIFTLATHSAMASVNFIAALDLYKDCTQHVEMMKLTPQARGQQSVARQFRAHRCVEYLSGLRDGITFNNYAIMRIKEDVTVDDILKAHGLCIPPETTGDQLAQMVVQFMLVNQSKLNLPRVYLAGHALRVNFPPTKFCTKEYFESFKGF